MLEFIGFAFVIALVTTLFAILIDIGRNLKYRDHLPLLLGLFFVALVLIVNPQQEPGTPRSLYELKAWSQFLLLPFFILAPLPYIEKLTGAVISKLSVFFGAFLAANFYYFILKAGTYYFEQYSAEGLLWTMCSIIPAFLIFYGMYLCEKFQSRTQEEKPSGSKPEDDKACLSSKRRKIVILFACLLVFWFSLYLPDMLGNTEPCGGFEVYTINQSQTLNGTVIHLTENDFREFPRMATFIRDGKTISGGCMSSMYDPNTCIGKSSFRCNEGQQFARYKENYLEYNGRYYIIAQSYVV
jgi:hypothetical protein